jgi:prepilin-type N-terminal cleavage/methylation domain-containing protein
MVCADHLHVVQIRLESSSHVHAFNISRRGFGILQWLLTPKTKLGESIMDYSINNIRKDEKGFTLVELAVVMIIIGLLIGGILKGQELITNARVTSTIAQMEGISGAYQDFRGQFNAIPGDYGNATTRIADCTNCADGGGNGRIDNNLGAAMAAGDEAMNFYLHLLAAGYITGMDGTANATFGEGAPTASIGGGFSVGQYVPPAAPANFPGGIRPGLYITVQGVPGAMGAGNGVFTTVQASGVDTRLDDGKPNTGSIVADTGNACADGAGADYDGDNLGIICSIAYRM